MKRRHLAGGAVAVSIGLMGYFAGRAHASGVPSSPAMTYSGVLTDLGGAPLAGTKTISVQMWDQATAGTVQCTGTPVEVTLAAGGFQVPLPDTCATAVHATPDLWIEVSVDGASMGRVKVGAVPYALEASRATEAAGALQTTLTLMDTSLSTLDTSTVKLSGDQTIAGDKTFTGNVSLACPSGTADTGAGFCIDATDRTETAYGSSVGTCGGEGKVVCSMMQLCVAKIRDVGTLGTGSYRVSDLMYFGGAHYLGGGGGGYALSLPATCAGIASVGPQALAVPFRCCRSKG